MEKNKYDVFISYSRSDYIDENSKQPIPGSVVQQVKDRLTAEGITFWFDEEGIFSGENFVEKIVNNIENSRVFLYLSTANANESKWTCKEIASADEYGKPIIPFRIDNSPYNKKVMFRISDLDFIDYYSNAEKGMERLVISIKEHLKRLDEKEAQKKTEETRRQEEQQRKKAEAEQRRIAAAEEIRRRCTSLNIEESKLELDRKNLLINVDEIGDKAMEDELKQLIITSSPLRKKYQEEFGNATSDGKEVAALRREIEDYKSKLRETETRLSKAENIIEQTKQKSPANNTETKKGNKKLYYLYGVLLFILYSIALMLGFKMLGFNKISYLLSGCFACGLTIISVIIALNNDKHYLVYGAVLFLLCFITMMVRIDGGRGYMKLGTIAWSVSIFAIITDIIMRRKSRN